MGLVQPFDNVYSSSVRLRAAAACTLSLALDRALQQSELLPKAIPLTLPPCSNKGLQVSRMPPHPQVKVLDKDILCSGSAG